jgi:hypothetical protein
MTLKGVLLCAFEIDADVLFESVVIQKISVFDWQSAIIIRCITQRFQKSSHQSYPSFSSIHYVALRVLFDFFEIHLLLSRTLFTCVEKGKSHSAYLYI